MKKRFLSLLVVITILCSYNAKAQSEEDAMLPKFELDFPDLATTWDEGIPLGNATIGALVWQKDGKLRLSLDRADLWDLRPMANLNFQEYDFDWVYGQWENNTYENVQEKYDAPYDHSPAPSKIPGGALEFDISSLGEIASVTLELKTAICVIKWKNGTVLKTFIHATEPIGWYHFENLKSPIRPVIVPPAYVTSGESGLDDPVTGQDLRRLGYEAGLITENKNSISYNQKGWGEFSFQVSTKWEEESYGLEGSWSISSQTSPEEHKTTAENVLKSSFPMGMESSLKSHMSWWIHFWNQSAINVPDKILQNQWYMEMYKLGSVARKGAPPISLQSVWTADNGKLPPWKGDFHHDLNTQLSYWPTYSGNHLDLEEGFIDWLIKYKPTFKKYTKDFYGTNGLNVPGVTTLTGDPMGGWIQYSFGPTVGAWLGQHFYLHWRYSMDREFLKNEAYPWIKEVAQHFNELSVLGPDGKRKLPLSSSPEVHNNSREAWFDEMTNFDLALVRWTYVHAAELASELGYEEEAMQWKSILKEWPDYAINDTGLMLSPDASFDKSHRHFSHLMAIHPLGLIDVSMGNDAKVLIDQTIRNLEKTGSSAWTGYSFSWFGNLKARALDGEGAAQALKDFATSFVLPNSFHVNGDQSGTGKSNFTYRPFTLEGNFAFAAGVQEMLLQSHTGTVQIFPAIPADWDTVSFTKLRAEGAFLVSAQKVKGQVEMVKISSEKGGELRLKNPFLSNAINSHGNKITWEKDVLIWSSKPGEVLELSI